MINSKITIDNNNCLKFNEECPVNLLPPDCLNHIFQYCSNPEVESFTEVGSVWKKVIVDEKHKEFSLLLNFSKFLSEELKENKEFCKKISDINEFYNMLNNPTSLKQAKLCVGKLKNEILNTLKTLEEKDLNFLKDLSDKNFQPYYSSFLGLAVIEKEIDQVISLPKNEFNKIKICEKLINLGNIARALEILDLLTDPSGQNYYKNEIFLNIANFYLDNGNFTEAEKFLKMIGGYAIQSTLEEHLKKSINNFDFDKAIAVVNMMPSVIGNRVPCLLTLFDIIIEKKELDKAIKIISLLPEYYEQNQCIKKVLKLLIENGKITEAQQVINLCSKYEDQVIDDVCKLFIQNNDIDFALEALKLRKKDYLKFIKLEQIIDLYIKNKNLDKALDVLIVIFSDGICYDKFSESLFKIGKYDDELKEFLKNNIDQKSSIELFFDILIREGKISKAIEAFKTMPRYLINSPSIKENIFSHLFETENLEMVLHFFDSIDKFENMKFFEPVFKFLIKTKNLDKANEIFAKNFDYNQLHAFKIISKLLLDSNNIDKLVEIYKLMPEYEKRNINIFELLVKNNNINKALDLVSTCPKHQQEDAIMMISFALSDLHQKNIKLVDFLIDNNNAEQALKIVDLLPENQQTDALISLITYFLAKEDLVKVAELEKILLSKPQSDKSGRSCSIQ